MDFIKKSHNDTTQVEVLFTTERVKLWLIKEGSFPVFPVRLVQNSVINVSASFIRFKKLVQNNDFPELLDCLQIFPKSSSELQSLLKGNQQIFLTFELFSVRSIIGLSLHAVFRSTKNKL